MNSLQKEADKLNKALRPLYDEVAELINNGNTVAQAFDKSDYYTRVTDTVLDGAVDAASLGTAGTAYALDMAKHREWYLNSKHLGGALSENVRGSAARKVLTAQLKKGLSFSNSVNALADSIDSGTVVKLPKQLRALTNAARVAGVDADTTKLVKDARAYVNGLSGGPARGSKQLKTAYTKLINSVESGKFQEKYVEVATQRKLRYVNERIARQELANSYELSRRRSYDEDEGITGYRIVLSDEHPVVDECDHYAEADLYNQGAGVYPNSSGISVPIHVMCLCTTMPVRFDMNNPRYSEQRSQDYIKTLDDKDRKRIIGAKTPISGTGKALKNKGQDPSIKRVMMPKDLLTTKGRTV